MSELKPCPFCGCEVQIKSVLMADAKTVRYEPRGYHKRGCQLQFAALIGQPTTEKGAIKKWNRRVGGADRE